MLDTLTRHLDVARLAATASVLAMIGCTGLIDAPAPTKAEIARQKWVDLALPALDRATCLVCHGGAAPRPMVDFLIGADSIAIHDKVMAFEPAVISLDAPQSSRLLNKGQHEGPPLVGNDKSDVLEWLQAEKEAATDVPGPGQLGLRTQDYAFSVCTGGLPGSTTCPINELALDTLGEGAGIAGAKITFVVQAVGSGIYLNNLKLVPGATGAYIEHPLFVSIPSDPMAKPIADTLDRFFNTKMNLMANATADQQQIAGGTAAFVNFPPENKLAIFFKAAKLYQPEAGGGTTGGCKVLTQFETSARVPLNNNCGGCHRGQNPNATSALDLTGADQANAMNACNQVRLRVNFTDIANSGLLLAPTPGNANHPYPFTNNLTGFNNFKTALNPWIIAERDAP